MASVRLPQTRGEIEAASAELLFAARHDVWSTNVVASNNRRDNSAVGENDVLRDPLIEAWFQRLSITGAMEKKTLANRIDMTLCPWSEDIRKLGAKRVVTILSRNRWRAARSASDFLASRQGSL